MIEIFFFLFGFVLGGIAGFLYCADLVVRNKSLQEQINKKIDALHNNFVD
jgi:hypothetical protein